MTTKEKIIDSFLDDAQRHGNKSIGWDQIGQMMDEHAKQQAIAFAMWLQRTNPTGLISTLYVKFIEHQNQKPTND